MEEKKQPTPYSRAKKKTLIIAAVFALIGIVGGIVLAVMFGAGLGIVLAAFVFLVDVIWLFSEMKRVKRGFCQNCGAKFDYNECVEWEVVEEEIKEKRTNPNSDRKQIEAVRIEHVEISCTCEECGAVQSFTEKYQTGVLYNDGDEKETALEPMIKKYFKF